MFASCKPGVQNSNLSRGYIFFPYCPDLCTNEISIYSFIHRFLRFYSVRLFINILSQQFVLSFKSNFLCLLFFFVCFFQIELDKIVTHRNSIYERLSQPVVTLDELNSAFQLLQELGDMENTIDDVYLPVENIYAKLRCIKPEKDIW